MRDLAIAAGMAGVLAVSVGTVSAQASAQPGRTNSNYGGGWRYGPFATQSACLAMVAEVLQSPYVTRASCSYLTYSPFFGTYDPGWYLWDFVQNPNL